MTLSYSLSSTLVLAFFHTLTTLPRTFSSISLAHSCIVTYAWNHPLHLTLLLSFCSSYSPCSFPLTRPILFSLPLDHSLPSSQTLCLTAILSSHLSFSVYVFLYHTCLTYSVRPQPTTHSCSGRTSVYDDRQDGEPYSQGNFVVDRPRLPIGYFELISQGQSLNVCRGTHFLAYCRFPWIGIMVYVRHLL